jgi:hypothetical protein
MNRRGFFRLLPAAPMAVAVVAAPPAVEAKPDESEAFMRAFQSDDLEQAAFDAGFHERGPVYDTITEADTDNMRRMMAEIEERYAFVEDFGKWIEKRSV